MGKRIVFLDYVRITACFLVMLVHAAENFYGADASGLAGNMSYLANESNRFWVAFYDGASRICVPLFIIVSAFLLAPMREDMTMGQFYGRRAKRILPPMISFMLLYTFLPLAWGGMSWEQSLTDLKTIPFNFPSMAGHLWFMYPLISLYLIIPVISPWLRQASAKDELIFIGIFAFSTFMPFLHRFVSNELWGECFWNGFHALWYCSGYLGYLVLAHYIRVHLDWDRSRKLLIGSLCLVFGALFTIWSFYLKGVPGQYIETPMLEWAWEFCTPNVLCATFGAFLLFSCIEKPETPKAVRTLSDLSFGMYLMHLFFINLWAGIFIGEGGAVSPAVPVYAAIPLIAVCTFICSAITTEVLSFIPGSQWVIGTHRSKAKA